MPLQFGESAEKTCSCRHKHCVVAQNGASSRRACARLHAQVLADATLFGNGPITAGRLKLEPSVEAGWGLVAKRNITAGTMLAAARCGLKFLPDDVGSLTDEADMDYRLAIRVGGQPAGWPVSSCVHARAGWHARVACACVQGWPVLSPSVLSPSAPPHTPVLLQVYPG